MTHVISEEKAFEIVQEFLTDILQISQDVLALYVIGGVSAEVITGRGRAILIPPLSSVITPLSLRRKSTKSRRAIRKNIMFQRDLAQF